MLGEEGEDLWSFIQNSEQRQFLRDFVNHSDVKPYVVELDYWNYQNEVVPNPVFVQMPQKCYAFSILYIWKNGNLLAVTTEGERRAKCLMKISHQKKII